MCVCRQAECHDDGIDLSYFVLCILRIFLDYIVPPSTITTTTTTTKATTTTTTTSEQGSTESTSERITLHNFCQTSSLVFLYF